jgi:hypothetical protein
MTFLSSASILTHTSSFNLADWRDFLSFSIDFTIPKTAILPLGDVAFIFVPIFNTPF